METIGLRELNQNPSRAVARVRAGHSIVVTDRGRPLFRMVPVVEGSSVLERMVAEGTVEPPVEQGMPDVIEDLVADVRSLSDVIIADRDRERRR